MATHFFKWSFDQLVNRSFHLLVISFYYLFINLLIRLTCHYTTSHLLTLTSFCFQHFSISAFGQLSTNCFSVKWLVDAKTLHLKNETKTKGNWNGAITSGANICISTKKMSTKLIRVES